MIQSNLSISPSVTSWQVQSVFCQEIEHPRVLGIRLGIPEGAIVLLIRVLIELQHVSSSYFKKLSPKPTLSHACVLDYGEVWSPQLYPSCCPPCRRGPVLPTPVDICVVRHLAPHYVLRIYESVCVLLVHLFCFSDSACKGNCTIFVFLCQTHFT